MIDRGRDLEATGREAEEVNKNLCVTEMRSGLAVP